VPCENLKALNGKCRNVRTDPICSSLANANTPLFELRGLAGYQRRVLEVRKVLPYFVVLSGLQHSVDNLLAGTGPYTGQTNTFVNAV